MLLAVGKNVADIAPGWILLVELSFWFVDIITDSSLDVLDPSSGKLVFICVIVYCAWR